MTTTRPVSANDRSGSQADSLYQFNRRAAMRSEAALEEITAVTPRSIGGTCEEQSSCHLSDDRGESTADLTVAHFRGIVGELFMSITACDGSRRGGLGTQFARYAQYATEIRCRGYIACSASSIIATAKSARETRVLPRSSSSAVSPPIRKTPVRGPLVKFMGGVT